MLLNLASPIHSSVLSIKEKIARWINSRRVILVVSATTGHSVQQYLSLAENSHIQLIVVVAHKVGNPRWKPFDPQIRSEIERRGGIILHETMMGAISRIVPMLISKYLFPLFGYKERNWEELLAVGGRVCLQSAEIVVKGNLVKTGSTIIAVAGENAALALKVQECSPLRMALMDVIHRNDIQPD
ncbi:MAG: hypothetical protein NUV91_00630 [Candidatus Omnitrophica bacterium]|nr:hypothetical protein [Candidatus Omnitrophota bacterium]